MRRDLVRSASGFAERAHRTGTDNENLDVLIGHLVVNRCRVTILGRADRTIAVEGLCSTMIWFWPLKRPPPRCVVVQPRSSRDAVRLFLLHNLARCSLTNDRSVALSDVSLVKIPTRKSRGMGVYEIPNVARGAANSATVAGAVTRITTAATAWRIRK